MSLTKTDVFTGDLLSIRHVACSPSHAGIGDMEYSDADTVVLPVRGVFTKHFSPGTQVLAEPTQALFFASGRPYRISHHETSGDSCLVLQFSPDALSDTLAAVAAVDSLHHPTVRPHASLVLPAIAARNLLWWRLRQGIADRLEIEETSVAVLTSAVGAARRERAPGRRRAETRANRQRQTDAIRTMLLSAPATRRTLRELAKYVHTTPYHLTRVFREDVGLPLHQYHLRLRLAAALDLLLDTQMSMTAIALDLGFATHSHFTAAFRRAIGVTPRRFRECASARHAAEVRKILIEHLPRGR